MALLREVDMNTILIAHQKNTLTSRNPRKNDANSLGNQRFLEFVYTDYFEAFEFGICATCPMPKRAGAKKALYFSNAVYIIKLTFIWEGNKYEICNRRI